MVLTQASVILGFDYETTGVVDMQMETLAISETNIPLYDTNPVRSIKAIGTLELKQLYPLRASRNKRNLYNNDLFNFLEYENLNTFLNRYTLGRNESTVYRS